MNVRLNGVRDAIAIINAEMPRALAEGSRAYCDIVRDQYTARAARVCDALVELASAYVDHEDFLSRVKSAGVNAAFLAPFNLESTGLAQIMADVRSGGSEYIGFWPVEPTADTSAGTPRRWTPCASLRCRLRPSRSPRRWPTYAQPRRRV